MMVYDQREALHNFRRQNEKRKFSGMKPPRQPKPKAWTHQNMLEDWKGKEIVIQQIDMADPIFGVLLQADPFTLFVQIDGQTLPTIIFKSALTELRLRKAQ